jgi:hypothetical protein
LHDLRQGLADAGADERVVNLAIFQLLNSRQLDLSFDRRLRVNS